jgi:hypothetical protein
MWNVTSSHAAAESRTFRKHMLSHFPMTPQTLLCAIVEFPRSTGQQGDVYRALVSGKVVVKRVYISDSV